MLVHAVVYLPFTTRAAGFCLQPDPEPVMLDLSQTGGTGVKCPPNRREYLTCHRRSRRCNRRSYFSLVLVLGPTGDSYIVIRLNSYLGPVSTLLDKQRERFACGI